MTEQWSFCKECKKKYESALSDSQKHLADANRGAQRQSGVNQVLVKELVQVKNALSESQKECEGLKEFWDWSRESDKALFKRDMEYKKQDLGEGRE